MVRVQCEKTGLWFESATGKQHNHPSIMAILQEAHRYEWLRQAYQALEFGKKQGYTTLEEFIQEMRLAEQRAKEEKAVQIRERHEKKQQEQEVRRQRFITNAHLRKHGYTWQKYENDEEDIDMFGAPAYEWTLYASDNRVVTVNEAMQELAWSGDTFSKKWLAERNIAENIPKIEQERQATREAVEALKRKAETFSAQKKVYQQQAEQALLRAGLSEEAAHLQAIAWGIPHTPVEDFIAVAPAVLLSNGRDAVPVINSDFRYGVLFNGLWCGIDEILERDDLSQQFRHQLQQYRERNAD